MTRSQDAGWRSPAKWRNNTSPLFSSDGPTLTLEGPAEQTCSLKKAAHISTLGDKCLVGRDATPVAKQLPNFRRNPLPPSLEYVNRFHENCDIYLSELRRQTPEDSNLHTHRHENLKSHVCTRDHVQPSSALFRSQDRMQNRYKSVII